MGMEIKAIFKKDFMTFFYSRLAYFLIVIYLVLSMVTTFFGGGYFQIDNSSLSSFFFYQPELFVIIAPALAMRLWADERRYGTMELLLTQPVLRESIVIGKFLAAWCFCILLLLLTTPLWLTTSLYVKTDNLHIVVNYLGCVLSAGFLCALSCCVSSFCSGPISAYILSIFSCAIVKLTNFDYFLKPLGYSGELSQKIAQALNFDTHYQNILQGQIGMENLIFFCSFIVIMIWLNIIAVDYKRG